MAVDNVATKVKMQQHVFCRAIRRLNAHQNKTSPTSLADQYGIDVTTRHHHARQHARGRSVAAHPVMQAWDRKPHFLSAVQAGTVQSPYRRCTTGTPAVKVYSVSHACYSSAAQDHPVYIKII